MDALGTLLVAARGEIAVRIMATAAVLGLRTVAVYPDDDADCAHVARADASVRLPGVGAAAYLDLPAVLAAARQAGADAVHPGYGFLSENPALARACTEAGLVFVGPSAQALELFGDKTRARERAAALGIDVPSGTGVVTDDHAALAFAASLPPGASVMVKARAGGGGRGLRPVRAGDDLSEALRRCRSEAAAAFGDDGVFVEELLTGMRHIEVQVLGDGERVQALGDRDCSLQRRRQKLLEIGPALDLDDAIRRSLHDAAGRLMGSVPYRGLATVEFLVSPERVVFLEVNPRLQVEHTVTEQVTGLDLVELALAVASGATLSELGLDNVPTARGLAMQARVNAETIRADGSVVAAGGTLARFQPPSGPGVRVDTLGYAGYRLNPRYDSLIAKVIASGPTAAVARSRLARALAEFDIEGVATNTGVLRALAARPELGTAAISTDWFDGHLGELAGDDSAILRTPAPEEAGQEVVLAPMPGTVLALSAAPGQIVAEGTEVAVLEAMKMEHAVPAPFSGTLAAWRVEPGEVVEEGAVLAVIIPGDHQADADVEAADADPDHVRPDLAETLDRHRIGRDDARPTAVGKRHAGGRLTARETVAALVDPDSFVEYGALAIAAQRRRRSLADLIASTPADGMITGTATVGGAPVAVLCYDYTVLAGTQGLRNHQKADRIYRLALAEKLPLVLFAEGGGGRPGDTDTASVAHLDVTTFRLAAQLSGTVPTVAVVSGYCFAGNAALASVCDLIIATEGSSLGMGGPAMIEGGGLGVVAPGDVGPMSVQVPNGVVDVLVPDDETAVATARHYVSLFAAAGPETSAADQRRLRTLVPESRTRAYNVRPIAETLADEGSLLEVRPGFGAGIVTALARIGGRPVGIMANNPQHLGGAIDGDAADKATQFLELCRARALPVISLCDTPGFMVGPAAAVRVYPTPDDRANRFELRVLDTDPHADAIPWPGPSITSITQPADLGPFEDAMPCRVLFLRRHAIFGGTTGSGKSGGLNVLMGNLTACADVVIWAIDLKRGMELGPWTECIDRLAVTPEQATVLLRDAVAIVKGRAEYLASIGRRTWEPTPEMPALVIVIDEYAELAEEAPDAMHYTDEIARLGRALAVTLIAATQRPTQKVMGQGAVRSQMDLRICFRVREQRDVDLVLGQGMLKAGWNAHQLNAPGKFLISAPEHDIPRRARAYLVTDQMVAETSAQHSQIPRELDQISRNAMLAQPEPEPGSRPEYQDPGDSAQPPEEVLWAALRDAPEQGWEIGELMTITGMSRTPLYRYLRVLVDAGRAHQVSRGRWRATDDRQ